MSRDFKIEEIYSIKANKENKINKVKRTKRHDLIEFDHNWLGMCKLNMKSNLSVKHHWKEMNQDNENCVKIVKYVKKKPASQI